MAFGFLGRIFNRVKEGLKKTRHVIGDALRSLIGTSRSIDKAFLDQLEDTLLAADIGVDKTEEILVALRKHYKDGEVAKGQDLMEFLKASLAKELEARPVDGLRWAATGPTVVLVVGVNGTGKTTSIAKLAKRFKDQKRSVLLAAGDTYRAAAIEQLEIWAKRAGVDLVKSQPGGDAAALAYDAVVAAQNRKLDLVLIDTAGRLHNREDLMRELEKIRRVIQKRLPEAPHECLLVLDATAGQNAIQQARVFGQSMGLTGLILTKLDGTAKGGATVAIKRELGLPVLYMGVGEGMDDLLPFEPQAFLDGIFGSDEG